MRKMLFILVLVLSVIGLKAQDDEIQTLFGSGTRISGFGGPIMSFTSINGEFAHMMGGGGAVLLNNFFLGGYGLGLTNAIPDYVNQNPSDRLTLGHGGFWLGYSLFGERSVHVTLSSLIGWGEFGVMQDYGTYPFVRDKIFVLSPTAELELNLTRYLRIGAGVSYNLYTLVDQSMHGYSNSDLSAFGGFLSFKFGWFYFTLFE